MKKLFVCAFLAALSLTLTSFADETKPSSISPEENLSISTKPDLGDAARKKLASKGESKLFSWWSPEAYRFSVGYEKGGGPTAVLSQDNLTFGVWFTETFGMDLFLGYNKAPGNTTQETTVHESGTSTRRRDTFESYSGSTGASNLIAGTAVKIKGFQNSWFQFYYGLVFAYSSGGKTESKVGSRTESIPDLSNAGNKTATETGFGTITNEQKGMFSVGPKIGTEFYIKWFPHLALGFATGILTTFGGDSTRVESTRNRAITYVNGVEQPDNSGTDSPTTVTTNVNPGTSATTFGIGGTQFQFTGIFSLRYVW